MQKFKILKTTVRITSTQSAPQKQEQVKQTSQEEIQQQEFQREWRRKRFLCRTEDLSGAQTRRHRRFLPAPYRQPQRKDVV